MYDHVRRERSGASNSPIACDKPHARPIDVDAPNGITKGRASLAPQARDHSLASPTRARARDAMYSISAPSSRSRSALAVRRSGGDAIDDQHTAHAHAWPPRPRWRAHGWTARRRAVTSVSAPSASRLEQVRYSSFLHFVAAEAERDRVVALDEQARTDAAERRAQPVHRLNWRRPRQQRYARRVEDGGRACGIGRRRHRSAGADARSRKRGARREPPSRRRGPQTRQA